MGKQSSIPMRRRAFAWAALATGVVLLIPLAAMQFTSEVRWSIADFVVMGALFFGACCAFILIAGKLPRRYWLVAGALCALAFLYAWAELAVGVFTRLGR